jgi:hypothetical protein
MKKIYFCLIALQILLFSQIAYSINIGITPSVIYLEGSSEKTYRVDIYISVKGSGIKVPVKLICSHWDVSSVVSPTFKFNVSQASEEEICSWVKFLEERLIVEENPKIFKIGGREIRADKITSMVINLPKNAEPGYHLAYINLIPEVERGGTGFGVGIVTTSSAGLVVNVEGNAIRSAKPINFLASWVDENRLRVNTIVENNGTVTMRIRVDDLQLIRDNLTIKFPSSSLLVKPKQIAYIPSDIIQKVEPGDYKVKAKISWLSGSTELEGMVRVPLPVKFPTAKAVEVTKPKVPIYIFLTPIIILIAIILKLRGRKKFYREF